MRVNTSYINSTRATSSNHHRCLNQNDLSPAVFRFTLGVHRSVAEQDLSDLEGVLAVSIAGREEGKVLSKGMEGYGS